MYDILGREVATLVSEFQTPGIYSTTFNVKMHHSASLPTGNYFYVLRAGDYSVTKKMVLMK